MEEASDHPQPAPRRIAWKTLLLGALLGILLGTVGLSALILGSYAFFKKEAVTKMAETKDLKPLLLRADFDWSVTDPYGEKVTLSDLKGQATLLHFWNPSCVSCVAEIPSMNALFDTFQPQGLNVVTIALHAEDDITVDIARHGIRFPVYTVDPAEIPPVFEARATPTTFIIDPTGFVSLKHAGAVDWSAGDGHAFIDALLAP